MSDPMKTELDYLYKEKNRHGTPCLYVRRNGRRIRIREKEGTAAFARAYADALERLETASETAIRERKELARAGTFGWLASRYFSECPEFKMLAKESRRARRNCIEDCLGEPLKPDSKDLIRDCPVSVLGASHIKMLRDRKASQPGAANNRRKHLSALFAWAVEADLMKANPVRDVKNLKGKKGGFYTWSVADVEAFEAYYPIGTKERLALALLLFTGSRRQDMVTFGRQHVRNGELRFIPKKTLYKRKDVSVKPWLPQLQAIIDASPCGDLTFLVNGKGNGFTPAGFGNWFREVCDKAGLHECSAHGLRKAGATIAAENGATTKQLMAIFDWVTSSQAEAYTRKADQKKLAQQSMHMLADQSANKILSHPLVAPLQVTDSK